MFDRYYSKDRKDYAIVWGGTDNGKTLFAVYYNGRFHGCETHEIKLYEWAKRLHGNAPSGTPYGYFRASKNGKRIIITV